MQNGQPGDPETTKRLANYLLDIGLGIRDSERPDTLHSIHKEYLAKVYAAQPEVVLEMYGQRCSPGVNQLDVALALDVCQSADAEYKSKLIENALETHSYYEDTLEQVQLELVRLYVELCQRASQQVIAQAASQTLTLPQKVKFFGQFFPADLLLYRLGLSEDQLHDPTFQQSYNFNELVYEAENELLSAPFSCQDACLPARGRMLSEQLNGHIGKLRRKLTRLVKNLPNHVDFQKFIDVFPQKLFTEDRAVLNCKKYNFELGLQQFAVQLAQPLYAESLCDQIFADSDLVDENKQSDIFLILLKVYLKNEPHVLKNAALALIARRSDKMPPGDVIELLQQANECKFTVKDLQIYLRVIFSQQKLKEADTLVVEQIVEAESSFQQRQLQTLKQCYTLVERAQKCPICDEPIKREAVVFENGRVVCPRCAQSPAAESVAQMKPVKGYKQHFEPFGD